MKIRIQTCPLLVLTLVMSFTGLASNASCTPRLIFKVPPEKFLLCPDLNGDGLVNAGDLLVVSESFGSSRESVDWNPRADICKDGIVDILDVAQIAVVFGSII